MLVTTHILYLKLSNADFCTLYESMVLDVDPKEVATLSLHRKLGFRDLENRQSMSSSSTTGKQKKAIKRRR
jgi:hypothetical protein